MAAATFARHATDDDAKTISRVGVQQTSGACIYFNEAWSQACVGGLMYIDLTTVAD